MSVIDQNIQALDAYSASFNSLYLQPSLRPEAEIAPSTVSEGLYQRVARAVKRVMRQVANECNRYLFHKSTWFRNRTLDKYYASTNPVIASLVSRVIDFYNFRGSSEEIKAYFLKIQSSLKTHKEIYTNLSCIRETNPLYKQNIAFLNELIEKTGECLVDPPSSIEEAVEALPPTLAPIPDPVASISNLYREEKGWFDSTWNFGSSLFSYMWAPVVNRLVRHAFPVEHVNRAPDIIVEEVAPSLSIEPSIIENDNADERTRASLSEVFNKALNNQELTDFILKKFFPENALKALEPQADGSYIVRFDPEKPSGVVVGQGTIIDGEPQKDPISGQVGIVGRVPDNCSKKVAGAYVVLDSVLRFKIEGNYIFFLDKEGNKMTPNDHGKAHAMSFKLYISTDAIRSDNSSAWIVFKANEYISLAPISLTFNPSNNEVELLYISDLVLRWPLGRYNATIREKMNEHIPALKQKSAFMGSFTNLFFKL